MLLRRVWYVLQRHKVEADLEEELTFHREMTRQRPEAHGVPATDATVAARGRSGSNAAVRERVRDVWIWPSVQDVEDLRYGIRQVRRSPQLASAVVLTLVIGIGLNSVAFSAFNGILFRAQVSRDPTSRYRRTASSWAIGSASGMARHSRSPSRPTTLSAPIHKRSPRSPRRSGPRSRFETPSSQPFEACLYPATTCPRTQDRCFSGVGWSRMTVPRRRSA